MKEIKGTYKCGHSWTEILVQGGSKHEVKAIQERYKNHVCPKCDRGGRDGQNGGADADAPGAK